MNISLWLEPVQSNYLKPLWENVILRNTLWFYYSLIWQKLSKRVYDTSFKTNYHHFLGALMFSIYQTKLLLGDNFLFSLNFYSRRKDSRKQKLIQRNTSTLLIYDRTRTLDSGISGPPDALITRINNVKIFSVSKNEHQSVRCFYVKHSEHSNINTVWESQPQKHTHIRPLFSGRTRIRSIHTYGALQILW